MSYTGKRNQMIEKRAALTEQARGILIDAESEARDLRPYEDERVKEIQSKIETLSRSIDRLAPLAAEESKPLVRQVNTAGHDGGYSSRDTRSGDGVVLGREERLSDWHAATYPDKGWGGDDFGEHRAEDFSLGKFVRGMVTGRWEDAEMERRALAEGTTAAGGALTPEPVASAVLDRIRNQSRVIEAGARVVPMGSDTLALPKLVGGVQGSWRNENTPVTESDPTFDRVQFTARTLAVLVRISYELFEDMSPEGATIIDHELRSSLALELDRVALRGTGTAPEPRGLLNVVSVEKQLFGGANGGSPTNYAVLVNLVSAIQGRNFTPTAAVYPPRTAKVLSNLADTTGQPLSQPYLLDGLKHLVTAQVPINLTTGTSVDTSEIFVGDWSELLIGVRPSLGVRLVTSKERYIDQMQVGLLAYLRADVQVAHGEAFSIATGVRG